MFTLTPFNIVDVYKDISDRKRKRRETFKVALKMCQNQIRAAVARDLMRCSYVIPGFIAGLPTFNMLDCITFVKKALETNGFVVGCIHPNVVVVSWDIDDLEQRDNNPSVMALEYKDKNDPDKNILMDDMNDRMILQDCAHTDSAKKKSNKFVLYLK